MPLYAYSAIVKPKEVEEEVQDDDNDIARERSEEVEEIKSEIVSVRVNSYQPCCAWI